MGASPFRDFTTTSRRFPLTSESNCRALPIKDARTAKIARRAKTFWRTRLSRPPNNAARVRRLRSTASPAVIKVKGSKTIVPAWARAKITCRLVPESKSGAHPQSCLRLSEKNLPADACAWKSRPVTARKPIWFRRPSAQAQAALRALKEAFGHEPVLMREGGSIPIVNDFKKILGADTLLLGLALPDDNAHSPNEKFDLDCFEKGQRMSALLWQELSRP